MGWTGFYYKGTMNEFDTQKAKEFMGNEFSAYAQVEKLHLHRDVGNNQHEIYAVLRRRFTNERHVYCILIQISEKDQEIFYKDMDESVGPAYYNCPPSFFNGIPAPNKYAEEWRLECVRKHN